MPTPSTARAFRRLVPTVAAAALLLTACGGSDPAAETAVGIEPQAAAGQTAPLQQGGGMARRPGASGLVAAVDGTTAQVQDTDSQTAVSWTDATTFTAQAAGTLADVKVGSCVVVRTTDQTDADATDVIASSVSVTEPVDGECAAPGGVAAGTRGGMPPGGARPSDAPRTRPSGAPGGGMRGGGATGEVTAVTADGFTVQSVRPGMPGEQSAEPQTQDVSVMTTDGTTVSETVPAVADAVQAGVCVTALGEADSTGSVAATSISVRPAENGDCTGGLGGAGGPGA